MSVHSAGTGSGWKEDLDVDQPHGQDYVEFNDLRIGVRKRINKEHEAFGDTTAGGEHIPGGCNVVDILDATSDMTNYWDDGTYTGGGLVWCISTGTAYGALWLCATTDATYTGVADDVTILKMHPDVQWGGQDVTWQGAHGFAADVSMDSTLAIDGKIVSTSDLSITGGDIFCDGTADFSTIGVDGTACLADVSVSGSLDVAGDVSVDGTTAVQDLVITGDSTVTFDAIAGETGPIFKIFGDWSTRASDTTYTARTDGIVTAYVVDNASFLVRGHTPYGTVVSYIEQPANLEAPVTFPVKAGDTWAVKVDPTTWTSASVKWLPFGDNT